SAPSVVARSFLRDMVDLPFRGAGKPAMSKVGRYGRRNRSEMVKKRSRPRPVGSGRGGQDEREGGSSSAPGACDGERTPVRSGQAAGDGEADAGAAGVPGSGRVGAVEPVEYLVALIGRQSVPRVRDRDPGLGAHRLRVDRD